MSDEANRSGTDGGGKTPAANQAKTEAMPVDDRQAAPPSGNLGSADPQAPTAIVQSAVDGGVPRTEAGRRGPVAGRPGSPEPDEADQPAAAADGGGV